MVPSLMQSTGHSAAQEPQAIQISVISLGISRPPKILLHFILQKKSENDKQNKNIFFGVDRQIIYIDLIANLMAF